MLQAPKGTLTASVIETKGCSIHWLLSSINKLNDWGSIKSTWVGQGPPRPTRNYMAGSSTSTLGTIYNVALMFPVEFTLFGGIPVVKKK